MIPHFAPGERRPWFDRSMCAGLMHVEDGGTGGTRSDSCLGQWGTAMTKKPPNRNPTLPIRNKDLGGLPRGGYPPKRERCRDDSVSNNRTLLALPFYLTEGSAQNTVKSC
jgi:hypothetical protein